MNYGRFSLIIFLLMVTSAMTHDASVSLLPIIEEKSEKTVVVRVFIHGTILAGYFFVDIPGSWKDQYKENSLIERAMASARQHPFLHQAELVLGLGLTDITSEIMVPFSHPLSDQRAAISIIRSFDRTDRCLGNRKEAYHYYTFGWSGALSERKRNKESGHLYRELIGIQQNLQEKYPGHTIRFELFAHSHGGQLIAHLPVVHKQFPDNNLFIDLAVLCATPLYKEKIQPMISSPLFGTILNLYSAGDSVQNLDFISTPQHYCVRHLHELNIPLPSFYNSGPLILDVQLTAYANEKVFNHHSFFSCCTYRLASHYHQRSYIRKMLNLFAPLPTLVLFPACLKNIEKLQLSSGFHKISLNFEHKDTTLHLETWLTRAGKKVLKNVHRYTIKPLSKKFVKEYKNRARSSSRNQLKYAFYHIIHN